MATANPTTKPAPAPHMPPRENEIRIISHSTLFYWWPVWAVGFLMALITAINGQVMAIVPPHTTAQSEREIPWEKNEKRDVLVAPNNHSLPRDKNNNLEQPHLVMANIKNLGV